MENMRWAGNVARIAYKRNSYKVLVEKFDARNHFGKLCVNWEIILKQILKAVM
jgi:hypothetical protein